MGRFRSILRIWIPIATASVLLSGLIYICVQQSLRQSANDPQIQIAQDLADSLQNGRNAQDLIGSQVDLKKSLATFVIVFDDSGKPIASSAMLDGRIPTPPNGVFEYTKLHKEDRITWEPKLNIREAAVLARFEGSKPGFVLVGRSLAEAEKRQSGLNLQIGLGLAVTLLGSLVMLIITGGV